MPMNKAKKKARGTLHIQCLLADSHKTAFQPRTDALQPNEKHDEGLQRDLFQSYRCPWTKQKKKARGTLHIQCLLADLWNPYKTAFQPRTDALQPNEKYDESLQRDLFQSSKRNMPQKYMHSKPTYLKSLGDQLPKQKQHEWQKLPSQNCIPTKNRRFATKWKIWWRSPERLQSSKRNMPPKYMYSKPTYLKPLGDQLPKQKQHEWQKLLGFGQKQIFEATKVSCRTHMV